MTTPKAKLAGLALIAALCAGFTLGLTAPAWAGSDEHGAWGTIVMSLGKDAYNRGDYAEAVKWWSEAAEQGHAEAQFNLGLMYGNGEGVPQDYAQAHMWYNLAASSFPPGKVRNKAVKNRDIVAAKMIPAQISEAQKLAREWMAAFEKRKKM